MIRGGSSLPVTYSVHVPRSFLHTYPGEGRTSRGLTASSWAVLLPGFLGGGGGGERFGKAGNPPNLGGWTRYRPGIEPGWEARTLANSYLNSLLIDIRNIYLSSRHGSPQCTCYMNTHELHLDVGRIELVSRLWVLTSGTCKSVCSTLGMTDHVRVTTMERLGQGYLHSLVEQLETDMPRPGIKPGWEASTLAKSYLNSLLIAIRNISSRQYEYNFPHRKQIYWAKDIIFLITEHEFLGAQVTLCYFTIR